VRIEPGETLLHYRIVDKLSEGGMGAVYRAEDTRLGREIASQVRSWWADSRWTTRRTRSGSGADFGNITATISHSF